MSLVDTIPIFNTSVRNNYVRAFEALELRRRGLTYAKVGEAMGISAQIASGWVSRGERIEAAIKSGDPTIGLTSRAYHSLVSCCYDAGIRYDHESHMKLTPQLVSQTVTERELWCTPNAGWRTLREVTLWLNHHGLKFKHSELEWEHAPAAIRRKVYSSLSG